MTSLVLYALRLYFRNMPNCAWKEEKKNIETTTKMNYYIVCQHHYFCFCIDVFLFFFFYIFLKIYERFESERGRTEKKKFRSIHRIIVLLDYMLLFPCIFVVVVPLLFCFAWSLFVLLFYLIFNEKKEKKNRRKAFPTLWLRQ